MDVSVRLALMHSSFLQCASNIVGSSGTVYDEVEQAYPGIRPCLDVTRPPAQTYGGPIYTEDGSRCMKPPKTGLRTYLTKHLVIWLQSQAWFIGHREPVWSSMRQVDVRVIFYLPGPGRAGTLITNFLGKFHLASELSSICSQRLRCDNPIERCSLGCGWVLCFGMLRTLTEQLDFAFELFDPIRGFSEVTHRPLMSWNLANREKGDLTLKLDSLHVVLEKWANLLQIDRYLSGIEELCLFFTATREFVQEEKAALAESDTSGSRNPDSNRLTVVRADFEAKKALSKINGQQRHCLAYVKRFETLFQLTTSVTAASIAHSVESSKGLGQRFARISLVLTGLAGIVTPVNILTSFYGMNVQEFSPGAAVGLDQFWQVGLPVLLACAVAMGVLVVWMGTSSSQPASGSGKQHGSARSKTSMIPGLDGIVR